MRLMLNGKLPTKEELAGDELVAQMLIESKAEGKTEALKDVPTKESIIQALKVEEIPDTIKQTLTKDVPTKESILQALKVEDVPETIKQKILEVGGKLEVDPKIGTFLDAVVQAAGGTGAGRINGNDNNDAPKSDSRKAYEALGR